MSCCLSRVSLVFTLTACLVSLLLCTVSKMPAMTPVEAASALLSKTKDSSPKPGTELNQAVGDKDVALEDFVLTQNAEELLVTQGDKDAVVQKRRNPERGAKNAQPTIPESQAEDPKSPKKKGVEKSGQSNSDKDAIVGKAGQEKEEVSSDKTFLSKGAIARAAVFTSHLPH